jgi:competence protein ComEC
MRRTTALSLIFGAVMAGVALGRFGWTAPVWLLPLLGGMALVFWRTRWRVLLLIALALTLGLWRTQGYMNQRAALIGLVGQPVAVTAVVADDPTIDPRGFTNFRLGEVVVNGIPRPDQINVRMQPTNLHRGYQVAASGKLREGFANIPAELSYPQLTVISTQQSWLEQFRQHFFVGMRTALPEPVASFGLGLLVGVRGLIPKDLQAELALVGLSHLVAVSGYNLTIIVNAANRLFERFGRGISLLASFWLIGSFLVVTGASASIVRASWVCVLALLAAFYGRRFHPVLLILIVAAVTALIQPLYLSDLGWLLSFFAFFGIMVLAPGVHALMGHPKNLLVRLLIETSTAQVMTVPLILYIFGDFSIVAPFTNLIVLPMVPLAMLVSAIAGVAGMIMPPFAGWVAWPGGLLMGFMLDIIHHFAALPWAGTKFKIGLPEMLLMYGGLIFASWRLQLRVDPERAQSLLEPVAVGGAKRVLV